VKKKLIISLAPALLGLVIVTVNAGVVPYVPPTAQEKAIAKFDQNSDNYVTEGEVEAELRETAINKSINLQKKGFSKTEVSAVIEDMEDSIKTDAEKIVHKLDKDGDELVEPDEVKNK